MASWPYHIASNANWQNPKTLAGSHCLSDVLKKLAYERPVEFLTADLCMFGDNSLAGLGASECQAVARSLPALRAQMRRELQGREAHPAEVVARARRSLGLTG